MALFAYFKSIVNAVALIEREKERRRERKGERTEEHDEED